MVTWSGAHALSPLSFSFFSFSFAISKLQLSDVGLNKILSTRRRPSVPPPFLSSLSPFPAGELCSGRDPSIRATMDASDQSCRLFGAQRSLHGLLGGGAVADVLLWRRKEVSGGLLAAVAASWALFYCVPGYTLLSFVSRVILIVLAVLFVWAKAARLLNRAPPPVPLMKISEDSASVAAAAVGIYMNKTLQGFENIALGKDSSLFYKVASMLLMTSIVGRLTDLTTLVYVGLVIVLTIPVFVEKFEEHIARFLKRASISVQACGQARKASKSQIKKWILEKKKLC